MTFTPIPVLTELNLDDEELEIGDTVDFVTKMNSMFSEIVAWSVTYKDAITAINTLGTELAAAETSNTAGIATNAEDIAAIEAEIALKLDSANVALQKTSQIAAAIATLQAQVAELVTVSASGWSNAIYDLTVADAAEASTRAAAVTSLESSVANLQSQIDTIDDGAGLDVAEISAAVDAVNALLETLGPSPGIANVTGLKDALDGIVTALSDVRNMVPPKPSIYQVDIEAIVSEPSFVNVADPNVADVPAPGDTAPILDTIESQIHRIRNNTTGILSGQNSATLPTMAVTRKYDVDQSTQYTASIHNSPENWYFYHLGRVQFFNADGSFHSETTSGFTANIPNASYPRQITFTVPSGAEKVAFNMRNIIDHSASNPITATSFVRCVENLQIEIGSSATDFHPYAEATYTPIAAEFEAKKTGLITVVKEDEYLYVRAKAQMSPDKDVVWRLLALNGYSLTSLPIGTPPVDFAGIRFVDSATAPSATVAAFNLSTHRHSAGLDEKCPVRINSMYLGGSHGVVGYEVTSVDHGKIAVDVGSIWSDGVIEWVLYDASTSSKLSFIRRNTGPDDKWDISTNTFTSNELTHVSGAVHTEAIPITSSVQMQFHPIIRGYIRSLKLSLSGDTVTENGIYQSDEVVLSEQYLMLNAAKQQQFLIDNAPDASPAYDSDAIAGQLRIYNEYKWNRWGALTGRTGIAAKDAYRRNAAGGDYIGAMQLQRLSRSTDTPAGLYTSIDLYVPGATSINGSNFKAKAAMTAGVQLTFATALLDEPSDPASHFLMIGNVAGAPEAGHLYGYFRTAGVGQPSIRSDSVANALVVSTSNKQYPRAVDYIAGDAAVGEVIYATWYRAPFISSANPVLTVPGVITTLEGVNYLHVVVHGTALMTIPVDRLFDDQVLTEIYTAGDIALQSPFVADGEITVNVTGYGDAIYRIGPAE